MEVGPGEGFENDMPNDMGIPEIRLGVVEVPEAVGVEQDVLYRRG